LRNFTTGYGDWVPPPPSAWSNAHLVGSFAYIHDLILYAAMADGIGETDIAAAVRKQVDTLIPEFNKAFYDPASKMYGTGLQTEVAMALWLGAVPDEDLAIVLYNLVVDIVVTNNIHTTTGIIGWKYLMKVLQTYGLSDVAVLMNLQTTYPSIGYMIEGVGNMEPATTVWELWDSDKEGPGMNSRNHHMFGSVGDWLYKAVLGVTSAPANSTLGWKSGYHHSIVGPDPYIVNIYNTTSASGRVRTPYGDLLVQWSVGPLNQTKVPLMLNVVVPFGTTAEIQIPIVATLNQTADNLVITEGDTRTIIWQEQQFLAGVPGISDAMITEDGSLIIFSTWSGNYTFNSYATA